MTWRDVRRMIVAMRRRLSSICLLSAVALVGCGDDTSEPVAAVESLAKSSELVPLKVRRLEREDRQAVGKPASLDESKRSWGGNTEVPWESEWLVETATRELKALLSGAEYFSPLPTETVGTRLVPSQLERVDTIAGGISVWRGELRPDLVSSEEFAASIVELRRRFSLGTEFKIVEVSSDDQQVKTSLLVHQKGIDLEAHAEWFCRWKRGPNGALGLQEIELQSYEEYRTTGEPLFTEVPLKSSSQIQRGIADWGLEVTRFGDFALTGHHGVAVGDVDGDGREDVFVCDAGSMPNRLYRQREDGGLEDVSVRAGVDWYEDSRSALLVDLDNDGDQDLVVATIAMIVFAENDGAGRFTLKGGFPGAQYPFSMASADYDLDGDLDVYVCLYGEGDAETAARGFGARSPVPFDDAENGGRNVLLENLGGFGFADVTSEVGLDQMNTRWSFAAGWEDYDRDGDPDLYVANDFGLNCLYRNDGGRFEEVANQVGTSDRAAGMSVSWGDYNRDGMPDLYVGNMFSSAGSRVGGQREFAKSRDAQGREELRRMAAGNSLFSGGGGRFEEVPQAGGASMGRWSWSAGFADLNNDGWEDLVVANGYLTGWSGDGDL